MVMMESVGLEFYGTTIIIYSGTINTTTIKKYGTITTTVCAVCDKHNKQEEEHKHNKREEERREKKKTKQKTLLDRAV